MKVHLVDGTYELFRNYFGAPRQRSPKEGEVGAVVGLIRTLTSLLRRNDVTHVGCAFDHVIQSFRNDLFPGYKTEEGVDPELLSQFSLAEEAASALGCVVWPAVDLEADDILASAAHRYGRSERLDQVVLCSPDKDLTQCVVGERIVCWDRKRDRQLDEAGVLGKFGVLPRSIPDYLGILGDSADGIPGLSGWGAKSTSLVLRRYETIEGIPKNPRDWDIRIRGLEHLCRTLQENMELALLYRKLATLRLDTHIPEQLDDLRWPGVPVAKLEDMCRRLGYRDLVRQVISVLPPA
jgi:5'-3' exonuclease